MATEVFEFLNESGDKGFTQISARPPVPGEENELRSNGDMSSGNNGSRRKLCKTAAFNKGEVAPPPAATPRKSNLEKRDVTSSTLPPGVDDEDVEAPLGFEPEGSAASSPPYSENITPPHLRWAENLNHLLSDSEGVALFKDYLELEQGGSEELQFWLACHGLKRKANSDAVDVHNIVKVIFKAYVRFDKVKSISKETKKEIVDKLSQKSKVDQCVFDEAQLEVEAHLRDVSYPAFLNSDLYVQYVNNYAESPKSSHNSSGSNSAAHVSQTGLLPVLHEDKELGAEEIASSSGVFVAPKTPDGRPNFRSASRHAETMVGGNNSFSPACQSTYPAHVSYAPVSAQDSELQSLSSDAHTDDTVSLTDTSSADGRMTYSRRRYKKIMKTNALQNREHRTGLHTQIIPRTERAPKEPNLAETNPARFAQLLIEKLRKEVEEKDVVARVDERLKMIQGEPFEEEALTTNNRSFARNTTHNTTATFMPIMPQSGLLEESAESILDFHCSRVWSSSHHSPTSRSPPGGRGSPFCKSPDRAAQWSRAKLPPTAHSSASESLGNVSFPRPHHHHHHHARKDPALSRSFDCSGGCEEKGVVVREETHQHIHHHHHHHHTRGYGGGSSSKQHQRLEAEQQLGNVSWREIPSLEHSRGRAASSKKTGGRKSASGGNTDSRVSNVYEADPGSIVPNFSNPSSEKVMKWINDTVRGNKGSTSADTDRSSSTKRTHRHSSAASSSQAHKQSSKSKMSAHVSNRSASMERGGALAWGMASGTLPSQPFVQDSNMPLPTPPNPTTQLEEAKRRLEESHISASAKSRSFTGVPSKEKFRVVPGSVMPPPTHIPPVRRTPVDQDLSSSTSESGPGVSAVRPSRAATGGGSSGSSQSDSVVVGMYYEQEPIPFRFTLPGRAITLEQIKHLNTKKGSFKYFFKRDSDEFGEGAVFEEVKDDSTVVPTWNGKIVAQVQRVD
ncbi:axin-1-like [Babylonia areolata]|uniref:axin-1-like n=1 Tax=Babylonia areolata TaxID=304850 RepID=UPI003FD2D315